MLGEQKKKFYYLLYITYYGLPIIVLYYSHATVLNFAPKQVLMQNSV